MARNDEYTKDRLSEELPSTSREWYYQSVVNITKYLMNNKIVFCNSYVHIRESPEIHVDWAGRERLPSRMPRIGRQVSAKFRRRKSGCLLERDYFHMDVRSMLSNSCLDR